MKVENRATYGIHIDEEGDAAQVTVFRISGGYHPRRMCTMRGETSAQAVQFALDALLSRGPLRDDA